MENDYWDYLRHGLSGRENKDHKYYMRVQDGSAYIYFYNKERYEAWQRNRNRQSGEPKPTRAQQKEWAKTKQLAGRKRLTGAYRQEKHAVSGRTAWVATEQYVDRDGQTKLRKKYISTEEAGRLRDAKYRKQRAENETADEKKARMKDAKKRYKKKTSAARRKRSIQKGAQTIARLFGRTLTFQKK